jgi:hypothetical protein
MFRSCPRQYWFSRYGSWGGWERDAPFLNREAYRLKKLSNRYLWTGNRVHETIRSVLESFRKGATPESAQVRDQLLETFRKDFRDSRENPKGTLGPKGKVVLIEHDDPSQAITDAEWRPVIDRALDSISGFFRSEAFRIIRECGPGSLVRNDSELESMTATAGDYPFPVFVTIDAAIDTPDGLLILDWKTGKPDRSDGHAKQLGLYALFAQRVLNAPPEKIRFSPVYLAYTPETLSIESATPGLLETVASEIEREAEDILSRIDDPDRGEARMERFPVTDNPAACRNCSFQSLCTEKPLRKTRR